ncbi:MAG: ATP-dependent sacrificial sulfur transferase LarE [bacterium]
MTAAEKEKKLRDYLKRIKRLAVAFSGGVDSTYLLKVAYDELGEGVTALTVAAAINPQRELKRASAMAAGWGIKHEIFGAEIDDIPKFSENPPDRCYYCKHYLFSAFKEYCASHDIDAIADGSNIDDLQDHRPGHQALNELGVISPLKECGFSKVEIRERSKELGLSTWDLPSCACLASRIPYDQTITLDKLKQIDSCEELLFSFGFKIVRVRHHGDIARIEVGDREINRFSDRELRDNVSKAFKDYGFKYITVDLTGYRTGSLNEGL